ncbi:MAG: response regulator transcription factor [Anaerolineae bacterium]|nr:response regulator transcription factor [Anaerolineae bacterium]
MAKILIAEDEPDIRDLITFTLRFAGHEVIATPNGAEAYEKAKEVIPDLIMMDVRMPRMTGYEACRKMKEIDALKPVPVVFLSAKGQESEVQAGLDAGAVEYILKPFAPDQLTAKVKSLLEKYGTGASGAQAPAGAPSTAPRTPASGPSPSPAPQAPAPQPPTPARPSAPSSAPYTPPPAAPPARPAAPSPQPPRPQPPMPPRPASPPGFQPPAPSQPPGPPRPQPPVPPRPSAPPSRPPFPPGRTSPPPGIRTTPPTPPPRPSNPTDNPDKDKN